MSHYLQSDFLVRPLETVYFGPPRSFSAGENHRGYSEFPPTPSTFQGLLRSQLLRAVTPLLDLDDWSLTAKNERADLVGDSEKLLPGWQIGGPFPARVLKVDGKAYVEPWLPTPRFVLQAKNHSTLLAQPIYSTHPGLNDIGSQNRLLGCPQNDAIEALGGWIGPNNLYHALTGDGRWDKTQHTLRSPPFVKRELRPGVAIDRNSATAEQSMLYFLDSLRFSSDSGFLGHFTGLVDERIPASALVQGVGMAGRKGRPLAFMPIPDLHPAWNSLLNGEHLPSIVQETDGFWLVLITPAAITQPLQPDIQTLLPSTVEINFQAALLAKPQIIGGYAIASGQSKPNRAYLPAGSVWWFSLHGGDATLRADALRQLNNNHVLSDAKDTAFGYGHTLVGLGPAIEEN